MHLLQRGDLRQLRGKTLSKSQEEPNLNKHLSMSEVQLDVDEGEGLG